MSWGRKLRPACLRAHTGADDREGTKMFEPSVAGKKGVLSTFALTSMS